MYKNGSIKLTGIVSRYQPTLAFEGNVIQYYKNGRKKSEEFYIKNQLKGRAKFYHENGAIMREVEYIERGEETTSMDPLKEYKLLTYIDKKGLQHIKDGNGYYKATNSMDYFQQGKYVRGFRDSVWTGENYFKRHSYHEVYENGKFVSGICIVTGKESSYSLEEEQPQFPGGIDEFRQFLVKSFIYPEKASAKGIHGRVIVGFVVETDGSLSNIKILKDLGFGTGEEAVRVIKSSGSWIPGKLHGMPVRVSYAIPFALTPPSN